jgi:CheY-like chemotaxis protein
MAELASLRVLVVEDEGGVALLIEDMLEQLGCELAGSIATLDKALTFVATQFFDCALLDVNLAGQMVFPVAEALRKRNIPFVFSTGYGRIGLPETFAGCPVLNKPFTIDDFEQKLCWAASRPSKRDSC